MSRMRFSSRSFFLLLLFSLSSKWWHGALSFQITVIIKKKKTKPTRVTVNVLFLLWQPASTNVTHATASTTNAASTARSLWRSSWRSSHCFSSSSVCDTDSMQGVGQTSLLYPPTCGDWTDSRRNYSWTECPGFHPWLQCVSVCSAYVELLTTGGVPRADLFHVLSRSENGSEWNQTWMATNVANRYCEYCYSSGYWMCYESVAVPNGRGRSE